MQDFRSLSRRDSLPRRLRKHMNKPRIFLGSSGKQEKLLQALERGLADVADVEPWTTSFNPGTTTLERLLELTREVDFAAIRICSGRLDRQRPAVFGTADGRSGFAAGQCRLRSRPISAASSGCAERSSFMRMAAKLPTDLLGLTCIRYGDGSHRGVMRIINEKLRKAIDERVAASAASKASGGSFH